MSEDLWGDFDSFEQENDIYNLFKEQSKMLSLKSNEMILGRLRRHIDDDEDMVYEFRIEARTLKYTKLLFIVYHPLTSQYPATLESFALDEVLSCNDYQAIIEAIRLVLSGDKVSGLLQNLLKYSRDL